jgi:indole-3-pyruvate monooxygenase
VRDRFVNVHTPGYYYKWIHIALTQLIISKPRSPHQQNTASNHLPHPVKKLSMEKVLVLIVGAGPSGLAAATCLSEHGIPYCIVEREDCSASLWRKRTYDRLKLHLAKEFCELPHMSHPSDTPKYITKEQFVKYVDEYVDHFNIFPKYSTSVESCEYDEVSNCWDVIARDLVNGQVTEYTARFLVVATGENSEGIIPTIPGLHDFPGDVIHSSNYKSWNNYAGKGVLVVGCGNSGMEIAYDLASNGVETSLVIRSPV